MTRSQTKSVHKLTMQILTLRRKVRALTALRNTILLGSGPRKKGLTARLMAARRTA